MDYDKLLIRMKYLLRSARRSLFRSSSYCPNCASKRSTIIHRKFIFTQLRRCEECQLLFRSPTDPPGFTDHFYEVEYSSGMTTDLPNSVELENFKQTSFQGTEKDYSSKVALFNALGIRPGKHRILDFGCSWGYGTWQFQQAGYDVQGFEVSSSRAKYAREKLDVDVSSLLEDCKGPYDVVFSSHVLEHLPLPTESINWAKSKLRPGGYFISFTPNGSEVCMQNNPKSYHKKWGGVHPVFIDEEFLFGQFKASVKMVMSDPFDLEIISDWDQHVDVKNSLSGWELLFVATLPS